MKAIEIDITVKFTQCVEVEVSDEVYNQLCEHQFDEIDVFGIPQTVEESKMLDFLDNIVSLDKGGSLKVEIDNINELDE